MTTIDAPAPTRTRLSYLEFPASVTARHLDCEIDEAEFRRFEETFAAYVRRREEIYPLVPGGATWPSFEPPREKILEYYLTTKALDLSRRGVYLDVASCLSLFPNFVAENFPAKVIRQDILYDKVDRIVTFPRVKRSFFRKSTGVRCIGSDACSLALENNSVDWMALHCSLEHFEGESDKQFAREAFRVLKPGGSLLVIPFYCGGEHQEIFKAEYAPGCQFQRYYSPDSFTSRVLESVDNQFEVTMRYYHNSTAIDASFYCVYSVCLSKKR